MSQYAPPVEFTGAKWMEREEDTLAWAQEENLLQKIARFKILDQAYVQLNQNRDPLHYYACTYYATAGAICDAMGYDEATYIRLVDAIIAEAIKTGDYDPKSGAYTAISAQIAVRVHNQMFPKTPVSTFRTEIGTSTFYTLLAHNFTMVMTYMTSQAYRDDAKDGNLDGVDFDKAKGGHCIRWSNLENHSKAVKPKILTALDNYYKTNNKPETGYRRYEIPATNIPFLKWEPYFRNAYFFISSDLL